MRREAKNEKYARAEQRERERGEGGLKVGEKDERRGRAAREREKVA